MADGETNCRVPVRTGDGSTRLVELELLLDVVALDPVAVELGIDVNELLDQVERWANDGEGFVYGVIVDRDKREISQAPGAQR